MPIPVKSYQQISNEIKQRLIAFFGEEFITQSLVETELTAVSFQFDAIYRTLRWLQDNSFLSTAYDEESIKQLAFERAKGTVQKGAVGSSGVLSIGGTIGTTIPEGSLFNSADGLVFETLADGVITQISLNIASIVRTGDVVSVTTIQPVPFANQNIVNITGITPLDFNGTALPIRITGTNSFEYDLAGTIGVGSGAGVVSASLTSLPILAQSSGVATNLPSGTALTIQTPIVGLDNVGYVNGDGLSGGADIEDLESLRFRALEVIQQPANMFSYPYYTQNAKKVPGVQRAWCTPPQNSSQAGSIQIYILPDNITNIDNVKAFILASTIPPTAFPDDVLVSGPILKPVDITITNLVPNTIQMQTAIINALQTYFEKSIDLGQSIDIENIRSVVRQTQDASGNLPNFTNISSTSLSVVYNELLTYNSTIFN